MMNVKKIDHKLYKAIMMAFQYQINCELTPSQCQELIKFIDNPLVIDECCEWKYLGVHMWQTCEQHARHMYPDKRYVYCPSCGKPIKYVEVSDE